jgi:lysophospholipase L1-like esterase
MHYIKMLLVISLIGFGMTAQAADMPAGGPPQGSAGKDPFMERLDAFAAKDKAGPPPNDAVEFAGSSMFEGWTEVTEHMAPIPAFNRAIGGSKTADILKYLDQLVIQYKPDVVVLYSGINDVSEGVSPATAAENIQKIVDAINAGLPETRVIYIAILNASNRPESVELINDANARIKKYAGQNSRMTYLDISSALVDEKGATRKEFLTDDGSHYNSAAYRAMAGAVKPAVQKAMSR